MINKISFPEWMYKNGYGILNDVYCTKDSITYMIEDVELIYKKSKIMAKLGTRHVSTITLYTYNDDPKKALEEAESICGEINHKYDCQAKVDELHEQRFGTLGSKKIDIQKL